MTEVLFAKIVTRALSDRVFRDGLAATPQKTLASAGYELTTDQLNAIVLAKPAEWGSFALEDIVLRIDALARKKGYP